MLEAEAIFLVTPRRRAHPAADQQHRGEGERKGQPGSPRSDRIPRSAQGAIVTKKDQLIPHRYRRARRAARRATRNNQPATDGLRIAGALW